MQHIAFVQQTVGDHQAAQKEKNLDGQRARVIVPQQARHHINMPRLGHHRIGMAIDHHARGHQPKNIKIVVLLFQEFR